MAIKRLLSISKENGVGLLAKPVGDCLTLNKKPNSDWIITNGTIADMSSLFSVNDYTDRNDTIYDTYSNIISIMYLRETFEPNSNVQVVMPRNYFYLDYDADDLSNTHYSYSSKQSTIKIQGNKYPVYLYSKKSGLNKTYEVTQL